MCKDPEFSPFYRNLACFSVFKKVLFSVVGILFSVKYTWLARFSRASMVLVAIDSLFHHYSLTDLNSVTNLCNTNLVILFRDLLAIKKHHATLTGVYLKNIFTKLKSL